MRIIIVIKYWKGYQKEVYLLKTVLNTTEKVKIRAILPIVFSYTSISI